MLSDCRIGDSRCRAVCDCEEAYWGSEGCSLLTSDLSLKQSSRLQIIKSIQKLMEFEDADAQTIVGWMNSLSEVAQIRDELSQESREALLDAVTTVVGYAREQRVDGDVILGLLSTVDAAISFSTSSNRRRRRLLMQLPADSPDSSRLLSGSGDGTNSTVVRAQSLLQQYSDFVSGGLLPGQDAVQVVLSQFRLYIQTLSASTSDGTTLVLPSSALESVNGESMDSVQLPAAGSQSISGLAVSVQSMHPQVLNEESGVGDELLQFQSGALSLTVSQSPCSTGATCSVEIVLQLSSTVAENVNRPPEGDLPVYETVCKDKEHTVHNYSCPDSTFMLVKCNGTASEITSQCPTITYQPTCSALVGLQAVDGQCSVISFTDTNVTCSCPLSGVRRRLQSDGTNDEATDDDGGGTDGEVSVSYVAMLETVESSFTDTVLSAEDLNSGDVARSWTVLVTLGLFIIGAVTAALLSHFADAKVKRSQSNVNPSQQQSRSGSVMSTGKSSSLLVRAMSFTPGVAVGKLQQSKGSKKGTLQKVKRNKGVKTDPSLLMAEDALPRILGSRSFSSKLADEIRNRHRWFGIYFHYSPHFPRSLRVASLVTNVVIMLFIQSLTYALTNPDNGECGSYKTRSTCLEEESPYATGETKCSWSPSGKGDGKGSCSFVEPDSDIKVILFVAIFSAVVCTPVALLADAVIMYILSAPTRKAVPDTKQNRTNLPSVENEALAVVENGSIGEGGTGLSTRPALATALKRMGLVRNASVNMAGLFRRESATSTSGGSHVQSAARCLMVAQAELRNLTAAVSAYRDTLTEQDQVEFDGKRITIRSYKKL